MLAATRTWLSDAFGVPPEARETIVARMLEGHARAAPTYWLQLGIALSLATLGLVLNGAAVVIGAMLVSPLMGPIVELGMGLAVGSPLLSIRSLVRLFWSVVVVVAGATLITAGLPFHEITAEISARTSPTALDLLVAVFCALAAALTTLRSASDGVSAASGTAIAIALVPPLCVVGFGLGTRDGALAQGAMLLFTANLCAILLFTVVTFWLFGFNLVDTQHLEQQRFEGPQPMGRSVRLVKRVFGSRYGTWLRLIIPVALVVTVWSPLTRALREVTWQVRTRASVQRIIHDLPLARAAVRSSLSVEHRSIHVKLVIVGKPADARSLKATLNVRIIEKAGIAPIVEVVAVPDTEAMEEAARRLGGDPSPRRPQPELPAAAGQLSGIVKDAWPPAAGELRRWRLDLTEPEAPTLELVHLGPPLDDVARSLLETIISERMGAKLTVRAVGIPAEPATAAPRDGATWLPKLRDAIDRLQFDAGLTACVTLPAVGKKRGGGARGGLAALREEALREVGRAPPARALWNDGESWRVELRVGQCDR